MKKIIIIFIIVILAPHITYAQLSKDLPSAIKEALNDAYKTGNNYVIEAVTQYTKEKYPAYAKQIESYNVALSEEKIVSIQDKVKAKEKTKYFSGNIDAGMILSNGNTEKQDLNASSKINFESQKWLNTLKLETRSSKENKTRTNEEYIINNQTKYKIHQDDYVFLELEHVGDRFSGYQYRNAQLFGYGHKFYNNDIFTLASEISVGARQSLLTNEAKENSLLGKASGKATWKITDRINLEQEASSSFGSDAVITILDTNIKTKVINSTYIKLNYNLQHIDDVPSNTKHIDTLTSISVGYEF